MKKRFFAVVSMILACVLFAQAFEIANHHLIVGGFYEVEFENPIMVKNGRAYVPLRELCDLLEIPISWNDETREINMDVFRKTVDVVGKTEYREEGVVPDAETAIALGKVILERYTGTQMVYETDERVYYLTALEDQRQNAWSVFQTFDMKNGGGWASDAQPIFVKINQNTGEVLSINTETALWENPPLEGIHGVT